MQGRKLMRRVVLGVVAACSITAAALAEEPKAGGVINAVIQPEPPSWIASLSLAMTR